MSTSGPPIMTTPKSINAPSTPKAPDTSTNLTPAKEEGEMESEQSASLSTLFDDLSFDNSSNHLVAPSTSPAQEKMNVSDLVLYYQRINEIEEAIKSAELKTDDSTSASVDVISEVND